MADPRTRREPAPRLRARTRPDGTPFNGDEPGIDDRDVTFSDNGHEPEGADIAPPPEDKQAAPPPAPPPLAPPPQRPHDRRDDYEVFDEEVNNRYEEIKRG